ncbi:lysylphosphatidylglycerol synthase transmembrane domain-containing protein [Pelagibacterium montanilacus]|uniref:lysylphosphatidylglycerol synthase transmembrane domain-containing protein n=1 Tax=Pelagibacterium montanilacus TaxID=2185280 RepID=UPI000F8E745B|nr:lysylphosphatidylglycerol synthase transmembrane domain-containing protein [Pelagibacterium montanilacus]
MTRPRCLSSWRGAAPLLMRLLVPLVLLALVLSLSDADDALARLGHVHWPWLALSFLALNLQTILSALRWQWVSARLSAPIGRQRAIEEYYLAQLVNQTVPGRVIGDASRAVRLRENTGGLPRAAQAVIIERLAGQFVLWTILALGLIWALLSPDGIGWPLGPRGTIATLVVITLAAIVGIWMARGRLAALRKFASAMDRALLAPDVRWGQLALGLAIAASNLAGFAFAARATGTSLSLEAIVSIVPLILSAMLIPATIAGWGYREGAAVALFPLVGAAAAAGLAASVAFGLVMLAASLPGVLVLLRRRQASRPAQET